MKRLLLLFTLISLNAFSQNSSDTLKNETIIKLTQSKLGDKLIIDKINTSPVKFDVSTDGLINLKKNNVSEGVISVMVDKQTKIDAAKKNRANNNSNGDDYIFPKSGIYFKQDNKYTRLDPTLVTSSSSRGYTSVKNMSQIEGSEANYSIDISGAEIYFNFSPAQKDLNSNNSNTTANEDYFSQIMNSHLGTNAAISPNEFKLVKLKVRKGLPPIIKRNKREYQSGKIGVGGADMSIGDRYIVNFKYEQVSEFTYKITLPKDVLPGQYCFVYLSNMSKNFYSVSNNNKVFDFGLE
jgi:hypothetical protein